MTGPGIPTIWFRADHELVGKVIAAKLASRTDPERSGSSFRVGDKL